MALTRLASRETLREAVLRCRSALLRRARDAPARPLSAPRLRRVLVARGDRLFDFARIAPHRGCGALYWHRCGGRSGVRPSSPIWYWPLAGPKRCALRPGRCRESAGNMRDNRPRSIASGPATVNCATRDAPRAVDRRKRRWLLWPRSRLKRAEGRGKVHHAHSGHRRRRLHRLSTRRLGCSIAAMRSSGSTI